MTRSPYDVIGIGNAIVDMLCYVSDDMLASLSLPKGSMTLASYDEVERLMGNLKEVKSCSGGSAANTMAGLACFDAKTAYIGKIKEDFLGHIFTNDLRSCAVDLELAMPLHGSGTARCVILITPDKQRTMVTYLGIAQNLCVEDLNVDMLAMGRFLYVEGYLWDSPSSKEVAVSAIHHVKSHNHQTVLALSDAGCVARHRFDFLSIINKDIDFVFGNEKEWMALFHATTAFELRNLCQTIHGTAIITRSERGSWIVSNGHVLEVDCVTPTALVDTTGAGDLYVSGFLYGLLRGYSLPLCGQLGSVAAAEVISHIGARPLESLRRVMTTYDMNSTRNKENVHAS